jgi:hypothetical protein
MAKVKYDVSGQDPEKSKARVFVDPQPGVYLCEIVECKPGFKNVDGKPDKKQPRLEVIYEVIDDDVVPPAAKGARLWDYISFGDSSKWKLDQFLLAVGETNTKKREGTFDTDSVIGMPVRIRVIGSTIGEGQAARYKAEAKNVMAAEEGDIDATGKGGGNDGDGIEDEDADGKYTREDLEEQGKKALQAILEELGVSDPKSFKGKAAIDKILELQDETDDGEKPATDYSTWNLDALKKECRDRDLDPEGKKKDLVKRLVKDDGTDDPF